MSNNDENKVVKEKFSKYMSSNYAIYAYSVINDRALFSVLDGLKPVQRRIIYQGYRNGYKPNGAFVKSGKWSSNVMGELHPHSDESIYYASGNMAAPWARMPIITGRGNFGMLGGTQKDFAASRYTEQKLSPIGWAMVSDLNEKPVPMLDNFDGTLKEPLFLPTPYPTLLISGGSGIAVGYACNFPQHNPQEVMDLAIAVAKNPDITVDEMLDIMKGPDWATGGTVITEDDKGNNLIKEYYETGSAKLRVRAKGKVDGKNIIIYEVPPDTSPEGITSGIRACIEDGLLNGVSDVRDLTDKKNGLNIEISVKRGFSPQDVLAELYTHNKVGLEVTFGVNMTALDEKGIPKVFTVKEIIQSFLDMRKEVLINKKKYALEKSEARKHELEGIIKVTLDLDKAINIIRNSDNPDKARIELKKHFNIDDIQAKYVLSMTLSKLTKQDRTQIEREVKKLEKEIKEIRELLASDTKQKNHIVKELEEASKEIVDYKERKTNIVRRPKIQAAAPRSKSSASLKDGEWGIDASGYLSNSGDNISKGIPFAVTKDGDIKIFNGKGLPKNYSQPIPIIPAPDNILISGLAPKDGFILFVTNSGKILKIDPSTINGQGIAGNGVAGIKFKEEGEKLVTALQVTDDDQVLTISDDGWKVTPVNDIPVKGRGGYGVVVHKLRSGEQGVKESSAGKSFKVNNKNAEATPRPKVTNKGKVSSWLKN